MEEHDTFSKHQTLKYNPSLHLLSWNVKVVPFVCKPLEKAEVLSTKKILGMVDYTQAKMNADSLAEAWKGWNLFYGGVSW